MTAVQPTADELHAAWIQVLEAVVRPGLEYFVLKVSREEHRMRLIGMYRVASICHPRVMACLMQEGERAARVQQLTMLPFVEPALLESLSSELSLYHQVAEKGHRALVRGLRASQAAAQARGDDFNAFSAECEWVLQRWQQQASLLPAWASLVRTVLTIQPSSAAAERAFSLLEYLYSPHRTSALEGHQEISLMLAFSQRAFPQ